MLEVHRWRQIEWGPSAVVALATSVNGVVVAVARESGAIELWNVAAGSVGWHCHLTIPGKEDSAISSLLWCRADNQDASSLGRLFSAGLDGFITEWDLQTLNPKAIVESYGGSVWQLAAEPLVQLSRSVEATGNGTVGLPNAEDDENSDDSDENSDVSDSDEEDDGGAVQESVEQRVVVGCDDGCVRLFTARDGLDGLAYRRCFPRVKGRVLSVAWSNDASKIFSGDSDGSIRCWDASKALQLFRITAGIGGSHKGPELCVWSLLVLRDGTIVSGDSTGSTQFWEGRHGTLLQALAHHKADVLSLVATPSQHGVYAAGADGQVVLYQHVEEARVEAGKAPDSADNLVGALADKWVCVGSKRAHTHDVRALAVATPRILNQGHTLQAKKKNGNPRGPKPKQGQISDSQKWVSGTAMLISGGSDSKLFTYPANAFLAFHPHDICPAPERPYVQMAIDAGSRGETVFMAQQPTWVDVWRLQTNSNAVSDMKEDLDFSRSVLGKRKLLEGGHSAKKSRKANGSLIANGVTKGENSEYDFPSSNGKGETLRAGPSLNESSSAQGVSPKLLASIKCKSAQHICCSAISDNGQYIAFSDRLKPRLYQLDLRELGLGLASGKKMRGIAKKELPAGIAPAQSMQFTSDCTRLLLGSPQQIMVVDIQTAEIVHSFRMNEPVTAGEVSGDLYALKSICASSDSQWLAAITSCGRVHILNLETLRHHWSVPVLDGSVATSAIFRRSGGSVLIVSTSDNHIHVLDVEARKLSRWSTVNGVQLSRHMSEFPGSIIGLSVPPSSTSTSFIAYSARAMCQIDFSRSLRRTACDGREEDSWQGLSQESPSSAESDRSHAQANGIDEQRVNGHRNTKNNFVVVNFKHPVLFVGHTSRDSLLVVEKPWLEVLRKFPAPVFRHLYGT